MQKQNKTKNKPSGGIHRYICFRSLTCVAPDNLWATVLYFLFPRIPRTLETNLVITIFMNFAFSFKLKNKNLNSTINCKFTYAGSWQALEIQLDLILLYTYLAKYCYRKLQHWQSFPSYLTLMYQLHEELLNIKK